MILVKIIADNPPNLERIPKDSVDDDYYFIESCDTIDIYIYIPNLIIMSLSSVDIHISVEWVVMMMMMMLLCKYEYSHMVDDWKGG